MLGDARPDSPIPPNGISLTEASLICVCRYCTALTRQLRERVVKNDGTTSCFSHDYEEK